MTYENDQHIKRLLKRGGGVVLLCLLLVAYLCLSFYITKHSSGVNRTFHHNMIIALATSVIPVLIFSCGRVFALIFMPLFVGFFLANIYLILTYNIISFDMLTAIAGTNYHEASSMLKTVPIFVDVCIFVILFATEYLCFIYARFRWRIVALCLSFIAAYLYLQQKRDPFSLMHGDNKSGLFTTETVAAELYGEVADGYVGNFLCLAVLFRSPLHTQVKPHKNSDISIIGKVPSHYKNIIIIIGESDFANRHFLYSGKNKEVTPHQIRLWKEKELCFIPKAHSGANFTNNAVPMMMSFDSPNDLQKLTNEKNLVELAKDNGFTTSWISDVDASSFAGLHYGYISNFSDFVARGDHDALRHHITPFQDMSLLAPIKQRMEEKSPSKFIVVHLNGSHQSYSDDFDKVDKEQLSTPSLDDYDRSLHKTDRFINQVYALAAKYLKDYIILYTPDHGEVVGEGHGLMYGGYDQYLIPVMIMGKNNERWCKKANELRTKYGYFTSIMDKYLILDMLGYQIDKKTIEKEKQKDLILHSDGKIYDYRDVPSRRQ